MSDKEPTQLERDTRRTAKFVAEVQALILGVSVWWVVVHFIGWSYWVGIAAGIAAAGLFEGRARM